MQFSCLCRQELSDEELKEAFSVFDVDDVGFITAKDVRAVLLLLLDLQTKVCAIIRSSSPLSD